MRKKYTIGVFVLFMLLSSACASPEEELVQAEKENAQTQEQDHLDIDGSEKTDESVDESPNSGLLAEDGRTVTQNYGSGDFTLKIDAIVDVPSEQVQEGTLTPLSMDVSLVETYLCDGETLTLQENMQDQNVQAQYISQSKVPDGQAPNINLTNPIYPEGQWLYDNFALDPFFESFEMMPKNSASLNDEERAFMDHMKTDAQQLSQQLGLNQEVVSAVYNSDGTKQYCSVILASAVDGFWLVDPQIGDFLKSRMSISDAGVNNANFPGVFGIDHGKDTKVLSVDELLSVIASGVEEKNINTYDQTIECIRLAYMVDNTQEELGFYPIWVLCASYNEEDGKMLPFVCMDARDGQVVFMY